MPEKLCSLRWPEESDYELVEQWLKPLSPTAALTGDANELVFARDVREANESGRVRYLMVDTPDGVTIGVVNHRRVGSAGSHAVGGAVGDPALWGAGAGAEAFTLLVDLLFHQLNAHRVEYHDRTIWSILREEFVAGANEHSELMPVADLVPERDKVRARTLLAKYLAADPPTSLRGVEGRAARRRPY